MAALGSSIILKSQLLPSRHILYQTTEFQWIKPITLIFLIVSFSTLVPNYRAWSEYLKEDRLWPLELWSPEGSCGNLLFLVWWQGNWGETLRTLSKGQEGPKCSSFPFQHSPLKKNSRTGTRESGLELASWIPVRPFHRGLPTRQDAQGPGARPGAHPRGPTPDAPPGRPGVLPQAVGVVPTLPSSLPAPPSPQPHLLL